MTMYLTTWGSGKGQEVIAVLFVMEIICVLEQRNCAKLYLSGS